jgi:Ser/Thr protein kinase RdoA (MazF antagonist)
MLRRFHDAVRTFSPPPGAVWRLGPIPVLLGEIVRHGDVGPWNTVWSEGHLVGLIDWDFAVPGPALADLCQMAISFVPLARDSAWQRAGFPSTPDRRRRLAVLYPDLVPVWHAFRDARAKRRAVQWLLDQRLINDDAARQFLIDHPDPDLP